MAMKWQKFGGIQRKRISLPRHNGKADRKGHFVMYTTDQKRFVVPLIYLDCKIIRQLLEMSEEEFGPPSDGPIILPCDAVFLDYIISVRIKGLCPTILPASDCLTRIRLSYSDTTC
ncbi:auxin-responsive protein SAUR68-like [Ipomoea triloba]|uniref:auxin-responsive protein SAUR68-like n=1 Tax=Ipomoea triloba TaxID=35885 RepID=UPI00125E1D64|nr:auxin-responsive protein SAUR68-like [Ipomoea triloba]